MGQIKNIKLHIVTDIKNVSPEDITKMAFFLFVLLQALVLLTHGETCTGPSVSTDTYTTKHMTLSSETAHVVEFTVNCKEEEAKGFNLYAELEAGVLVPVAMVPETNSYQVSWVKDHKKAQTGSLLIKMYDDEGYTAYRKAQRSEGDISEVSPLFTVTLDHPGVSKEGLFLQTEFIAVVAALLVWWCANSMRSHIME